VIFFRFGWYSIDYVYSSDLGKKGFEGAAPSASTHTLMENSASQNSSKKLKNREVREAPYLPHYTIATRGILPIETFLS
jgi:hypothetical protein